MRKSTEDIVRNIIKNVRRHGDKALIEYTKKFDGVLLKPNNLILSLTECGKSLERIDPELLQALKQARKNIYDFAVSQKNSIKKLRVKNKGCDIEEMITNVDRAGVYIPGGRFSYPSSVLMNVVPAKAAGVKEVIVTTPKKNLSDAVKAALFISGADKIIQAGGAQAIAALAYGTKTVPKVDIIVGPGNKYVSEAKKQVFGEVGIDMIAGPSEVIVWADKYADYNYIIEDLLAQAEHDPDARAMLITNYKNLADKIYSAIPKKYKKQISVKLVKNDAESIEIINSKAPEHLEIIIKNAKSKLKYIKNAGAIFIGKYSPVAMGDYFIGPSHTLPTGGSARFSSGLSVYTFLTRKAVMSVSKKYVRNNGEMAAVIANSEGLTHHARSIEKRIIEK
ncbi:MAG: histidinol dehydrogenase [Elusimicrobiota bacterium]